MKIVILAAGAGSRLGGDSPKPLTKLANGQSMLGQQLDTISRFASLDDVLLVVGYHKEEIMGYFPNLLFVYNSCYSQENTSKSLLRALAKINEDVLWINGDVVFHPSVFQALQSFGKNGMVVNCGPVGAEEVKYSTNSQGRILEVSKHVAIPQGEALGLNFFTARDLNTFKGNLAKCLDSDYFEKAIELSITAGIDVWSLPVDSNLCTEVDFPSDLVKANDLLESWALPTPDLA